MNCPKCTLQGSRVYDTKKQDDRIVRYRRCPTCGTKWRTEEIEINLRVKQQAARTIRQVTATQQAIRAMGEFQKTLRELTLDETHTPRVNAV